jgi:hypothetical protein
MQDHITPAFPQRTDATLSYSGMTLRDYFAAKAMQGLLSNRNAEAAIDEFARKSYRMADAMLKARE